MGKRDKRRHAERRREKRAAEAMKGGISRQVRLPRDIAPSRTRFEGLGCSLSEGYFLDMAEEGQAYGC